MGTIYNCATGEIIIEPQTEQEILQDAWENLRYNRNKKLSESDLYVLSDRWENYSIEERLNWTQYRQNLRDLPQNTQDPLNPVWPIPPS